MRALSVIILLATLLLPSGHAPASQPIDISPEELQTLQTLAALGDVKARQWFEKAAAQGYAEAQYSLGGMYKYGEGVPRDYTKARGWYEKAAAQGIAKAQYDLGMLYDNGLGMPQDYTKARGWYEQAAAQGIIGAQFNLGVLYANGRGAPQDYVRAYMWLNLAAASTGDEQRLAVVLRDAVAIRMTPAQIAEAQRLSQQCQAQQFKGC